jgi:hypothetical protein
MMTLRPDIVVTRPDSPEVLLVVEIKAGPVDVKSVEEQLKRYMVHMSCPVGMLVTDAETRFYRNRYTDYEPDNIEMIGSCTTGELLGKMPTTSIGRESYLESPVEEWLDSLRVGNGRTWPPSVREAIESSVLPVVVGGVVRAGGPRWRRTGS